VLRNHVAEHVDGAAVDPDQGRPPVQVLGGTARDRVGASGPSAAAGPSALKVMTADRASGGNWVPIRFLASYLNYFPAVEPQNFDACPILLTQPAEDRWSPLELSQPVLSRITRVPVETVMLTNASHYPIEEPGLQQMQDAIAEFATTHA
jgi:pimeloyl-ACP methyl ester carboxylesterase